MLIHIMKTNKHPFFSGVFAFAQYVAEGMLDESIDLTVIWKGYSTNICTESSCDLLLSSFDSA